MIAFPNAFRAKLCQMLPNSVMYTLFSYCPSSLQRTFIHICWAYIFCIHLLRTSNRPCSPVVAAFYILIIPIFSILQKITDWHHFHVSQLVICMHIGDEILINVSINVKANNYLQVWHHIVWANIVLFVVDIYIKVSHVRCSSNRFRKTFTSMLLYTFSSYKFVRMLWNWYSNP